MRRLRELRALYGRIENALTLGALGLGALSIGYAVTQGMDVPEAAGAALALLALAALGWRRRG